MNEERTAKFLGQVEDIRGLIWHIYSIAVNQVAVAHRKTFEVMTNVHQPTRFGHKQIILIIFFPIKKKKWHERRRGITMDDISRGFKQVSLPDDFAQKYWVNWKLLPCSIKVLKLLSENVEIWKNNYDLCISL